MVVLVVFSMKVFGGLEQSGHCSVRLSRFDIFISI